MAIKTFSCYHGIRIDDFDYLNHHYSSESKQGHKHILMFCRDSNVMLLIYSCKGAYFENKHVYTRYQYCPPRIMILHEKRPIALYPIINMSKYD